MVLIRSVRGPRGNVPIGVVWTVNQHRLPLGVGSSSGAGLPRLVSDVMIGHSQSDVPWLLRFATREREANDAHDNGVVYEDRRAVGVVVPEPGSDGGWVNILFQDVDAAERIESAALQSIAAIRSAGPGVEHGQAVGLRAARN